MQEVKAHARYIRMSPRKVRLVVDAVRGMNVEPALAQLQFMSQGAARPVKKLIESAIANASHNFKLSREGLFIKAATVDQGPTLKRWRPRAMGSAAPILKRTCHITVILGSKAAPGAAPAKAGGLRKKDEAKAEKKAPAKKAAAKKTTKK